MTANNTAFNLDAEHLKPAPHAAISLAMISKGLLSLDMPFPDFMREAWKILEPNNPLIESWYTDLICEHLQLVTEGQIQKLLINIPPRSGKSNIVTIMWPAWTWTVKPHLRFVFCSYSAGLSVKHSVDRRLLIESSWYQKNWGNVYQMMPDQNQKNEYENTARGRMMATSVGGTLTGKGGDVIVEDDMLNPQESESAAARAHMISMHKNVLSTRLDNPKAGVRVIVEQRTHHRDLTAHVLESEKGWTHLRLPLIAPEKTSIVFPISKREIVRAEGELLNHARIGQKEADELKLAMGSRAFVAQCQQDPTAEEGNILRRAWWKHWRTMPEGADITIQSWDMTFKKTEDGSFVVGQLWKKRGANFYLIDQFRDRCDFTDVIPAMVAMKGKYPETSAILVENKANGPAIISQLTNRIPGILPIEPAGSKLARAQAVAPLVEAGNVHLPEPSIAPWVFDCVEECAAFTGADGETNDQVDAMSQALIWLHQLDYQVADMSPDVGWLNDSEVNVAGGFHD